MKREKRTPRDPEDRAFWQLVATAAVAFVFGFLLIAMGFLSLLHRVGGAEMRWWDIIHMGYHVILLSLGGGLGFATAASWIISRWHYRRGMHRCPFCGRALKGLGIPCECPYVQSLKAKTTHPGTGRTQYSHQRNEPGTG